MKNENLSAAAVALKVWQAQNGLTNKAAGELLGIPPSSCSAFRSGHRQPGPEMRERIANLTGGTVKANDWDASPPPPEPSVAMMELSKWRKRKAHNTAGLAALFDVSRQVVSYYLNGHMKPSPAKQLVIERVTNGVVRPGDWSVRYEG